MIDHATTVHRPGTEKRPHPAITQELMEAVDPRTPVQPVFLEAQQMDAIAADENARAEDERSMIITSLGLLTMFVFIFVLYIVLQAAQML